MASNYKKMPNSYKETQKQLQRDLKMTTEIQNNDKET